MSESTVPVESEEPVKLSGFARKQVIAVTLTSFLTDISSEMMFNMLPLFLAQVLHVPTSIIGLIDGIAETTASLLKSISGWLSDRLRQRKWIAVFGYGLSMVSKPFLLLVTSWIGVLVVRFADRAGKGIRTAPRDALIADSIDQRQRGAAFGIHRAGDTAGAVMGLVIALLVVLTMESQSVQLTGDTFRTLVAVSIVPALLAVIVLAVVARDVPIKLKDKAKAARLSFGALNPQFRSFLFIVVIFTLGNSSDSFLILRASNLGLSVAGVLGMLITFNLVYAILSGPAGVLSDRIGRRRLIVVGWLIYSVIYLGFALAANSWQVWALYGLYGLYYGLADGSARALIADLVPSEQRGTAYGFYNMAIGIVALPASLIAGILWQGIGSWAGFGPSAPFLAGAILSFIAVALFVPWRASVPAKTS